VISYPDTDYRYIRITVWDDGGNQLLNLGADIYIIEDTAGEIREIPSVIEAKTEKSDKTEFVIDLSHKNTPSTSIGFEITEANFKRLVTIYASNTNEAGSYREVGGGTIYSINTPTYSIDNEILQYSVTRARYLKITIENNNDPPLSIDAVTVVGVPEKITFYAEANSSYYLYFRNSNVSPPSYDIKEWFSYLDLNSLIEWNIKNIEDNTMYIPPGDGRPFTERYPALIWSAIALVLIVLGIIILATMRSFARDKKD